MDATAQGQLSLTVRTGLPAEVAYLRESYPRPLWRGHANYGQLADFWLQVHGSLREYGKALEEITEAFREGRSDATLFQQAFVPRMNQFLQHLMGHHQIEDQAYFPKFRALDPRMAVGFELLENDHVLIHERLLGSVDSARGLMAALSQDADARRRAADAYASVSRDLLALLLRHLEDEEELVIPGMLQHGERSLA